MAKKYFAIVLSIIILSCIVSCTNSKNVSDSDKYIPETPYESPDNNISGTVNEPPTASIPLLPDLQPTSCNNSIDRAFARIAAEHNGELEGNTIFSYLYSLAWEKEFRYMEYELLDEMQNPSWDTYLSHYRLYETAIGYARKRSESQDASLHFEWIARFYKMLVYDCLAQFDELGIIKDICSDEEELYQTLNTINYSKQTYDDYDSVALSILEDQSNPMPVYADLRQEGIYLAYAEPFGVVLTVDGDDYLFPWAGGALTPRLVLPRLYMSDYDMDGADELVVILYVDSGTGVAVTELHIVELDGMDDLKVTGETIEGKLFHRLSASYDPVVDEVEVRLDNQILNINTAHVDKEWDKEFHGIDLRSIIYFTVGDDGISVHISVGLCGFDWATPFAYVEMYANVFYNSTMQYRAPDISLLDCRLELSS